MKLIRFGNTGSESPGYLDDSGNRRDLTSFGEDFDQQFFGNNGIQRLEEWLDQQQESLPVIDTHIRWAAPVANPSKIICVGLNYSDHAKESGMAIPEEPVLFFKATTSLTGPYDTIMIPPGSKKTDWEVELAVIIGKKASHVSEEDAMLHVAGYSVMNDVSERAYQLEGTGQWVKGKSYDTFAPLGPVMATRDEIANVHNLNLWLKVNDQFRQQGNTDTLIFKVPFIVSYISRYMTLLPGDIISTGTPPGVGAGMKPPQFLKEGDVVELGIDGLGSSKQMLVQR
ncbi:MAG: 2-hydroxyhepta-2,4-diene-1,7-dioate isomerase [Cyclobacteriaceae bacterium]|nr:MAG: 2-hydroxyhepta-2,4-diene-1,7-dioate isomerase [Cyclobacteriaceae bacterium]